MNDYRILACIAADRRRAARRAAQAHRLAQAARSQTPGRRSQWLAVLGGWLVMAGTRLQARRETALHPRPQTRRLETI